MGSDKNINGKSDLGIEIKKVKAAAAAWCVCVSNKLEYHPQNESVTKF